MNLSQTLVPGPDALVVDETPLKAPLRRFILLSIQKFSSLLQKALSAEPVSKTTKDLLHADSNPKGTGMFDTVPPRSIHSSQSDYLQYLDLLPFSLDPHIRTTLKKHEYAHFPSCNGSRSRKLVGGFLAVIPLLATLFLTHKLGLINPVFKYFVFPNSSFF